jgi:hypothetical protein
MIKGADLGMESRIGRAAYIYAGARNLSGRRVKAAIDVDGSWFFTSRVSCALAGERRQGPRWAGSLPRGAARRRAAGARCGHRQDPAESVSSPGAVSRS